MSGTEQSNSAPRFGVFSEVGELRRVLVCEPGLAHHRLTPSNNDDLLFDDVMWVDRARDDHRAFVAELVSEGVEVLELHRVLTETLAVPGAKDWILDRKVTRTTSACCWWSRSGHCWSNWTTAAWPNT
ncbi:MAG: arginine deiminase family protein [Micropruina sp.]